MAASVRDSLTRGEVALIKGVCTHTVRKWERKGLLKATYHNKRVVRYDPDQVASLKHKRYQRL